MGVTRIGVTGDVRTYIHTYGDRETSPEWGSLRLAPININILIIHSPLMYQ
uniref:Uncharacterized protein n=1 Tax=Amphimedon queenslandica TaxID=400682 RepID=A0A1X7SML6_AMPQE